MLMSAPKDHMTAFKTSRLAQILMARIIVIVDMDTYGDGKTFCNEGRYHWCFKWRGDGL